MARTKSAAWKKQERAFRDAGWATDVKAGSHGCAWACPCGQKIYHGGTSKDADTALRQHLRVIRRHAAGCTQAVIPA